MTAASTSVRTLIETAIRQVEQAFAPGAPRPGTVFLGLDRQSGGLTAIAPDADFELFVDDRLVNVGLTNQKGLHTGHINRIGDSALAEQPLHWRQGMNADALPVAKNVSADWRLRDGNTAYIKSLAGPGELPVSAVYHCPVEGHAVSVTAGETYTFQASFAVHRATAKLRLHFMAANGDIIQSFDTDIGSKLIGGQLLSNYELRHLTATAPESATRLMVELVKSITNTSDKDSYLFFTRPALTRSEFIAFENLHHDLPESWSVNAFRLPDAPLQICAMAIPDLALDGGRHRIDMRHRTSGGSATLSVFLPASVSISGRVLGVEGAVLVAEVTSAFPVSIALWADGQPTGITADSQAGDGRVRLPLPVSCCDGRPHVFELRRAITGQLLAQHAMIGPVSGVAWQVLQTYAGAPLPAHLSPLAAYRHQSLVSGLRQCTDVPLHVLHDILVTGFDTPRHAFDVLPFPAFDTPDVSIVIPVHDHFDVTYVCLAALQFAATTASFEVIVVDDGSSDATLRLNDIAPGVTVLRNGTAQGFVAACNRGAAEARGRYIFFLNNDTEPTAHFLDELIFAFENFADVGLVGSRLIYPDGQLQEAGGIVWNSGNPWNYGRLGNVYDPRFSYSRQCDYVSGAAIMIDKALWNEVGGFSQEFMPAYFEDTDLAFKVRAAGRKVMLAPLSIVVHHEGVSNGTDETAGTGLKRYQEINRPKFQAKWAASFAANGAEGGNIDLAKDRGISGRVLFLDYDAPQLDRDAGSYAAIQEIRMFQAMGCKVTFASANQMYAGRHTALLQRLGVEVIYSPFCAGIASLLQTRGKEFDLVYITRYSVARSFMAAVIEHAPQARRIINVADLHFLREIRDALLLEDAVAMAAAVATREAEIAALGSAELILSYSHVEQAVITSHITHGPKAALLPWVVDVTPLRASFAERRDVAFLGGFGHQPNVGAVKYFATEVMPLLRAALPGVRFLVYGSKVTPEIEALATADIVIKGYIADVAAIFDTCRVFVAPLLTGAGMKGKVLDCLAAGIPSVLSPIAAEGIGIRDGVDCAIAAKPAEWVEAIAALYNSEAKWNAMSASAHDLAAKRYSFAAGVTHFREVLGSIGFATQNPSALCVTSARPPQLRHQSPTSR